MKNKAPIQCTRRLTFCAGHRVLGHESKCQHIHGHNYVVHVTCERDDNGLDTIGRVVDFGVIKDTLKPWIDDKLDHSFLLDENDDELICMFKSINQPYFAMANPTAENIAELIALQAQKLLPRGIRVVSVTVEETENCSATFRVAKHWMVENV